MTKDVPESFDAAAFGAFILKNAKPRALFAISNFRDPPSDEFRTNFTKTITDILSVWRPEIDAPQFCFNC